MNLQDKETESKRMAIEAWLTHAYNEGSYKNLYDAYNEAIKLMDKLRDIEINTHILEMEAQSQTASDMGVPF